MSSFRPYLFCLELAIRLADLSLEAYYDPPGLARAPGAMAAAEDRSLDLSPLGFHYIDSKSEEAHDTFVVIARARDTKQLVVIFRGSASRKHWSSNVRFRLRPATTLLSAPLSPFPPEPLPRTPPMTPDRPSTSLRWGAEEAGSSADEHDHTATVRSPLRSPVASTSARGGGLRQLLAPFSPFGGGGGGGERAASFDSANASYATAHRGSILQSEPPPTPHVAKTIRKTLAKV